ncbi:hypothetical protein ACS0TY_006796 [Phlomoides rotata]
MNHTTLLNSIFSHFEPPPFDNSQHLTRPLLTSFHQLVSLSPSSDNPTSLPKSSSASTSSQTSILRSMPATSTSVRAPPSNGSPDLGKPSRVASFSPFETVSFRAAA